MVVLTKTSESTVAYLDTFTGDISAQFGSAAGGGIVSVLSARGAGTKAVTGTGAQAGDTGRFVAHCLGDPDAAGGTNTLVLQGSIDQTEWVDICTLTEASFAAVSAGTATMQIAHKTFSPWPFLRSKSTAAGQTTQVYTLYVFF